jgi:hypothetical protein
MTNSGGADYRFQSKKSGFRKSCHWDIADATLYAVIADTNNTLVELDPENWRNY